MSINSSLFSEVYESLGYAIPTQDFWDLWHSDRRDLVVRMRFIPMPIGFELGAGCKWIVRLPSHVEDYVSYNPPSKMRPLSELLVEAVDSIIKKRGF